MANKGNPEWRKGGPSPNPAGRGAPLAKSTSAPGYDGVNSSSGYLPSPPDTPAYLRGAQRFRTHAKIRKRPPVSIATQLRSALFAGVQWSVEPNESGHPDAERAAEIVRRGLLEARFQGGRSWPQIVARAADGRYFTGHAVFATALGRAPDGTVRFSDIAHRPQKTIHRWLREREGDESTPFVAVEQQSTLGARVTLPLGECFYLARNVSEDTPDGQGVLDEIGERWDKLVRYEALEGTELFSSLGGTPIARIPQEELALAAEDKHKGDDAKIAAYIAARTRGILNFIAERIKHPDRPQWLSLSSAPYKDPVTGSYSTTQKWGVEIVKGEVQGLPDIRKIIADGDLDIARMLGVEFVFVGGGDSSGSFGMHDSKISMLGATLSAESWLLARAGEDQLARRLVAANGLDPDLCTPSLVPSPIAVDDVLKATQTLVALNAANLPRNHPAKRTVFDRLHLPYQDEKEAPLMLPSFGLGGPLPATTEGIDAELDKLKETVK